MTDTTCSEGRVVANDTLSDVLRCVEIECPEIAGTLQPGQFVHMHVPGIEGHILRRPFSVFDISADRTHLKIIYQVKGAGTVRLAELSQGNVVDMIGPIGTPWQLPADAHRVMIVGGGVGAAPLFLLAGQAHDAGIAVDVVLGGRSKSDLVTEAAYRDRVAADPRCSTDDGSYGLHGFCTQLVAENLSHNTYDAVYTCGPEPMMKLVSQAALDAGVPAFVSLEKRMACGVGACLSCIVETVDGRKRACVDGPVFDASKVVW